METRLQKAKQNMFRAAVNKAVGIVLPFIIRTVLIKRLGAEYLGLGSLFTSLLQVLNLAELGFGAAIVYALYLPMAKEDEKTVCELLSYFRRIYRIVGAAVLTAGIAVMPLLPRLISGQIPDDINLYYLYLIYLVQAVFSYWFLAYRQSLLTASQQVGVIQEITAAVRLVTGIIQIVLLLRFPSFYVYCAVLPVSTLAQNLILGKLAARMYPQYRCIGTPDSTVRKDIRRHVAGLFISKLGGIGVYSSDSIVISAFLGLTALAVFQNYLLIVNALHSITILLLTSAEAGIGNSLVTESKEKNYRNMQTFQLIYMWIGVWFVTCLICLIQPFMKLWLGPDMMFSETESIVCCVYFYTHIMNDVCYIYRTAAGLWWEERYRAVAAGVFNLVMNIILVQFIGVTGVMLATILYQILMDALWGTRILFKYTFNGFPRRRYLCMLVYYAAAATLLCLLCRGICGFIPERVGAAAWIMLAGKGLICTAAALAAGAILFRNLPEYRMTMEMARRLLRK